MPTSCLRTATRSHARCLCTRYRRSARGLAHRARRLVELLEEVRGLLVAVDARDEVVVGAAEPVFADLALDLVDRRPVRVEPERIAPAESLRDLQDCTVDVGGRRGGLPRGLAVQILRYAGRISQDEAAAKAELEYDGSPARAPHFQHRSRSTSKQPCVTSSSSRRPAVRRNPGGHRRARARSHDPTHLCSTWSIDDHGRHRNSANRIARSSPGRRSCWASDASALRSASMSAGSAMPSRRSDADCRPRMTAARSSPPSRIGSRPGSIIATTRSRLLSTNKPP